MTTQTQLRGPVNAVLVASVSGLVVSLGVAGYFLLTEGHAAFNTNSVGLNWGLPIVTYDFFVVTSTGLAFVASLAFVFRLNEFYAVAKRCLWLALAMFAAGGAALMLELGHPIRSLYAIPLNFQYVSPMFWKVQFIGAYLLLLLALFYRISTAGWTDRTGRGIALLLFIALLGVTLLAGAVFGMMAMRPFWHDGLVPLYFLLEGILAGVAFTILVTYIAYGTNVAAMPSRVHQLMAGALPKLFAALIGLALVATLTRAFAGAWSNAEGLQIWQHILYSPLFALEIAVGLAVPLWLMLAKTRTNPNAQLVSAVLVALAVFIGKYEFVIGGQMVPLFKGNWAPGLIEYAPSLTEWMLLLLSLSIAFAVYAVGEKFLDLSEMPAGQG